MQLESGKKEPNAMDIASTETSTTTVHYDSGYVVSIRFIESNRSYFFHTDDATLQINDKVVVETIRGLELALVNGAVEDIKNYQLGLELKPVIRKATMEDVANYEANIKKAQQAYQVCNQLVHELNLQMRLVKAEYTLDATKVIIMYVADDRVDFRELLRELAANLKCRIELRQIGTRDRSKMVGGIGACGLPLCCATFLGEFDGISINMAKNQFLALNIQKLSGHCGKLICCLKYEDDAYSELKKGLPKIGQKLIYDDKHYRITSVNVLNGTIRLESSENILNMPIEQVKDILNKG